MLTCVHVAHKRFARALYAPFITLRPCRISIAPSPSLSWSRNSSRASDMCQRRPSRPLARRSFATSAAQAPSPSVTDMQSTPRGSGKNNTPYSGTKLRRSCDAEPFEPLPLQQVPQLPKYPARWLSEEEVRTYLHPLYQRGWYLSMEALPDGQPRKSHTLKKTFAFRKRIWSAAFAKEVADTMIRLNVRLISCSSA